MQDAFVRCWVSSRWRGRATRLCQFSRKETYEQDRNLLHVVGAHVGSAATTAPLTKVASPGTTDASGDAAKADASNAGGSAGSGGTVAGGAGGAVIAAEGGSQENDSAVLDVRTATDANAVAATIATGQGKPTGIALSSTAVYWADEDN